MILEPWEKQAIRFALAQTIKNETKLLEAMRERHADMRGNKKPGRIYDRMRSIERMQSVLGKIENA